MATFCTTNSKKFSFFIFLLFFLKMIEKRGFVFLFCVALISATRHYQEQIIGDDPSLSSLLDCTLIPFSKGALSATSEIRLLDHGSPEEIITTSLTTMSLTITLLATQSASTTTTTQVIKPTGCNVVPLLPSSVVLEKWESYVPPELNTASSPTPICPLSTQLSLVQWEDFQSLFFSIPFPLQHSCTLHIRLVTSSSSSHPLLPSSSSQSTPHHQKAKELFMSHSVLLVTGSAVSFLHISLPSYDRQKASSVRAECSENKTISSFSSNNLNETELSLAIAGGRVPSCNFDWKYSLGNKNWWEEEEVEEDQVIETDFYTTQKIIYHVGHGLLTTSVSFKQIFTSGTSPYFDVEVLATGKILDVTGDVRSWQPREEGKNLILRIFRSNPADTSSSFRIDMEEVVEEKDESEFTLSGFYTLKSRREHGEILVHRASNLDLEILAVSRAIRVDISEVSILNTNTKASSAAAFKYTSPTYNISISLKRYPEVNVVTSVADKAEFYATVGREGALCRMKYAPLRNNDKQFLSFSIPHENVDIWAAFVNGRPVKPSSNEELSPNDGGKKQKTVAMIPIEQGNPQTGSVSEVVEISYFVSDPSLRLDSAPSVEKTLSFLIPYVDIPVMSLSATFYVDASPLFVFSVPKEETTIGLVAPCFGSSQEYRGRLDPVRTFSVPEQKTGEIREEFLMEEFEEEEIEEEKMMEEEEEIEMEASSIPGIQRSKRKPKKRRGPSPVGSLEKAPQIFSSRLNTKGTLPIAIPEVTTDRSYCFSHGLIPVHSEPIQLNLTYYRIDPESFSNKFALLCKNHPFFVLFGVLFVGGFFFAFLLAKCIPFLWRKHLSKKC